MVKLTAIKVLKSAFQHVLVWNNFIFVTRDHRVSIFVSVTPLENLKATSGQRLPIFVATGTGISSQTMMFSQLTK